MIDKIERRLRRGANRVGEKIRMASLQAIGARKYRRFKANQRPKEVHAATAEDIENGVKIVAGPASFDMRVIQGEWAPPHVHDFAGYGLAALSLTNGWDIRADMPVSADAPKRFDHIADVYRLWSINRLSDLRISFSNPVSAPPLARDLGSIICLSGGVDSTFAAVVASEEGQLDGFLLIAGADYRNADEVGFVELQRRVSDIASIFGKDLTVVESTIRQCGFSWEMLHGFNLACCLHFFSATFRSGGFALDNTIYQDVVRNPWGNNAALPALFSAPAYPVKGYGEYTNRVGKLKRIYEHDPELIDRLSFCWEDTSIGGNCGQCRKCVETRLALHALGISDHGTFASHPDLEEAIGKFKVGKTLSTVKGQLVRTAEIVDVLPRGRLRDKYRGFEEEVRKTYFALDPMR